MKSLLVVKQEQVPPRRQQENKLLQLACLAGCVLASGCDKNQSTSQQEASPFIQAKRNEGKPLVQSGAGPKEELYLAIIPKETAEQYLERLRGLNYGPQYNELIVQLAKYFAANEPDKGISWLNSMESSPENAPAASAFGYQLGLSQPERAMDIGASIQSPGLRQSFYLNALPVVSYINPKEGWKQFEINEKNIPDANAVKIGIIAKITFVGSIDEGWNSLIHFPNEGERQDALNTFFRYAASRSVEEAVSKIEKLNTSGEQINAVREIFKAIPGENLDSGANYLNKLPQGELKDAAIDSFIPHLVYTSPREAAAWARSIQNPVKRETWVDKIVDSAKRFDPNLANEIIQQSAASNY